MDPHLHHTGPNATFNLDSPSEPQPFVPLYETILNATVGVILTLFILSAQSLVFYVVSQDERLRHPNTYFMTSLALADALIGIIVLPLWTLQSSLGYWPLGEPLCFLWNIADYSLCAVSINTLCYIATDRYLCLAFPLRYPARRCPKVAKVSLAVVWIITLVFQSILIGMTQHYFTHPDNTRHKSVSASKVGCQAHYVNDAPMTVVVTCCMLWIPMTYTSVLYFLVFRITRKVAALAPPVPQDLNYIPHQTSCNSTVRPSNDVVRISEPSFSDGSNLEVRDKVTKKWKRSFVKSQVKAVRTIGLLWVTFTFCWCPVGVALLCNALHPGFAAPWLLSAGYWLAYLNSLLNPLCYTYGNPQFRDTLIRKVFGRRNSS